MSPDEALDILAIRVFTTALNDNRAGELLQHLFDGGTVTLDYRTGELMLITREQMGLG